MGGRLLLVIFFALGGLCLFSQVSLAPELPQPIGKQENSLLFQIESFIRNYQPASPGWNWMRSSWGSWKPVNVTASIRA